MAHGLLPRGQALRSPPLADGSCDPRATFGISAIFTALSPPSGQIAHAFLALPPLPAGVLLHPPIVRLACLIHAASVRSEPESNSQRKNSARRPADRAAFLSLQIDWHKLPSSRIPSGSNDFDRSGDALELPDVTDQGLVGLPQPYSARVGTLAKSRRPCQPRPEKIFAKLFPAAPAGPPGVAAPGTVEEARTLAEPPRACQRGF